MNFPQNRVRAKIFRKNKRIENLESNSSFQISKFLRKNKRFSSVWQKLIFQLSFDFPFSVFFFDFRAADHHIFEIWIRNHFLKFCKLDLLKTYAFWPKYLYIIFSKSNILPPSGIKVIFKRDPFDRRNQPAFSVLVEVRFNFAKNPVSHFPISSFPFSLSQTGRSSLFLETAEIIPAMHVARIPKIENSNIFTNAKSGIKMLWFHRAKETLFVKLKYCVKTGHR